MEIEEKRAVCFACAQQCGVRVQVRDGRVIAITGDREHPGSAGFICPKGSRAHEVHYDPARIHRPLRRIGPRGSGKWQTLSWDEALDDIAGRIGQLAARYGAETLAHGFGTLHGAEWGIGERFLNLFGSPNAIGQDKICYGPTALGESLTYGFGPTVFTYPTPGTTRCLVVWGMRPSASAPLLWKQIVAARRAGAALVVVDPERTREAMRADRWLQLVPGSDAALALALVHCVIDEGLHDCAFVAEHTEGFDALAARAAEYPPERVAEITGVPAEAIRGLARLIATRRPTLIHAGNGICQGGRSVVQTARALACLIAITGNLGRPGAHVLAGPPRDVKANGDAMEAQALAPAQRAKRLGAETYPFLGAGYDAIDRAMAAVWHGKRGILNWLASAHEPTLWQAIVERRPYPVTALILQYHNPVGGSANAARARAALLHPNLELFVAHDLFLNATTSLADYVLPAQHWLEKPYFSTGLGPTGFSGDYVAARPPPLPPEHEHRSDYDLWRDLGRRLAQAAHWPDTAEAFWDSCLAPAGLAFDELGAKPGPVFGAEARRAADAPEPADPARFGTPSGKVELRSRLLADWGLDPLPAFEWPAIFQAAGKAYPLVLTTGGRRIEGFHQQAPQQAAYRRKYPEPIASLHPDTAAAVGVADGSWIEIETPIGRIRQRARVTPDLAPNVIHADRWWYPERGDDRSDPYGVAATNVNMCTADDASCCDPVFGAWLLRGLPCRVSPAMPQTM